MEEESKEHKTKFKTSGKSSIGYSSKNFSHRRDYNENQSGVKTISGQGGSILSEEESKGSV
jgi:hypothetical protein